MRRTRPRARLLGNLFRDQLDRYGELEHIAERWRDAVAELPPATHARRERRRSRSSPTLAAGRDGALLFGVDDPRRRAAGAAARGRLEVLRPLRPPVRYDAAYVAHLGDYRCPMCGHARPALDVAARDDRARTASTASRSRSTRPREQRASALALPGLYNVYNALAAASLALRSASRSTTIAAGLERFAAAFGRFERFAVGDRACCSC